jgi:hypothetical protein
MKQVLQFRVSTMAAILCVGLAAGVSAQYQGWTIPDTAKAEKRPVKSPEDAAKKGKALTTATARSATVPKARAMVPIRITPPISRTSSAPISIPKASCTTRSGTATRTICRRSRAN